MSSEGAIWDKNAESLKQLKGVHAFDQIKNNIKYLSSN